MMSIFAPNEVVGKDWASKKAMAKIFVYVFTWIFSFITNFKNLGKIAKNYKDNSIKLSLARNIFIKYTFYI
jgi:hypothetical protein